MRVHPAAALIVLLPQTLAGCTGESDEDGALPLDRTWALGTNQFAEVNLEMRSGDRVRATWSATGDLAWDVHSHPPGGFVQHQKGTARSGTIDFQSPSDGLFSILWENGGAAQIELEATVTGDATLHSVH